MITRSFVSIIQTRLKEKLPFIQVLVGPRQVGKTTGVKQILDDWRHEKHFISGDSPTPLDHRWLRMQWEQAKNLNRPTLFVIDEIQKIQGWAETVKELYEQLRSDKDFHLILLGSASLNIQKGLSESLVGRYELTIVPHWDFFECQKELAWAWDQFLTFGGYPAAGLLVHDVQRWTDFMLFSIVEPVLSRDLSQLVTIHKPALFRQTFQLAMQHPAQELSFQKMLGQLQEKGNASTIKHYLELFDGAWLLKLLYQYSTRPIITRSSSPKILPLAPALISCFSGPKKIEETDWKGRVFEAVVGAKLNTMPGELYYWRKASWEVDFIFKTQENVYAIEVKSGRKKHSESLGVFVEQFPGSIPLIINNENIFSFLSIHRIDEFVISSQRRER